MTTLVAWLTSPGATADRSISPSPTTRCAPARRRWSFGPARPLGCRAPPGHCRDRGVRVAGRGRRVPHRRGRRPGLRRDRPAAWREDRLPHDGPPIVAPDPVGRSAGGRARRSRGRLRPVDRGSPRVTGPGCRRLVDPCPRGCDCELCDVLVAFLEDPSRRVLEWPIAQGSPSSRPWPDRRSRAVRPPRDATRRAAVRPGPHEDRRALHRGSAGPSPGRRRPHLAPGPVGYRLTASARRMTGAGGGPSPADQRTLAPLVARARFGFRCTSRRSPR